MSEQKQKTIDLKSLLKTEDELREKFLRFLKEKREFLFIDAFGTIGGRNIDGYLVPIRLKPFDRFMAVEYSTPERLGRYFERLVSFANRWLERWSMARYNQQQSERMVVGYLRFTNNEEYLGLFMHFDNLAEAEGMKIVIGASLIFDIHSNKIIAGEK